MPSYVRGAKKRRISDAEIVRLYVEARVDSDTIGAMARCGGSTVLSIVRASGGTVRPSGGRRRHDLALPRTEIIARYLDGQSGPRIAAAAGCTPSAVYHILRAAGVTLRDSASAGKLAERLRAKRASADG